MPILGYFTVVGAALIGLLFAADAYMPRKEHLSFVSHVDGLPAAYKGEPARRPAAAPHIAPLPAVAETTGSGSSSGFALAGDEPRRTPALTAAPVAEEAAKPAKPKVVARKRQFEPQEDHFGHFGRQDYGRQDFGFRSREPSAREPSWRDSWATGGFQQAREPRSRRSAWGSGNDFGYFR